MASSVLFAVMLVTTIPTDWEEIPPWVDSSTQAEIWESLENCDPTDPRSIRVLDLTLEEFRSRTQYYLLLRWSRHFENNYPGTPLGCHALAWRCLMLPEGMRDKEDLRTLEQTVRETSDVRQWLDLLKRFPNDITGIMAGKLAFLSDSKDVNLEIESFSHKNPHSGIAAMMKLREGMISAKHQDWSSAIDPWIQGIETYPIPWEIPQWIKRLEDALTIAGHSLQAEIVRDGTVGTIAQLRIFRHALGASDRGHALDAVPILQELKRRMGSSPPFIELIDSHLNALREQPDESDQEKLLFASLDRAPISKIPDFLVTLFQNKSGPHSVEKLFSIANIRFDRGEYPEAVLIWSFMTEHFRQDHNQVLEAYNRLIDIRWKQFSLARDFRIPHSTEGFEGFIGPLIEQNLKEARVKLEEVLVDAEEYVQGKDYSFKLLRLIKKLYRIHSNRGSADRPGDLFIDLAMRSTRDQQSILSESAKEFRTREALAIIEILGGSSTASLSHLPRESLLNLYLQDEKYREAAAIARESALDASGTPYANDAWFKTAELEYKAGDFESSASTLIDLIGDLEEGSEDHTQANRMLGLAEYQTGDYEKARKHFNTAIESGHLDKDQEESLYMMNAYSNLYHQRYDQAREGLNELLGKNPSRLTERKVSRLLEQLNRNK